MASGKWGSVPKGTNIGEILFELMRFFRNRQQKRVDGPNLGVRTEKKYFRDNEIF